MRTLLIPVAVLLIFLCACRKESTISSASVTSETTDKAASAYNLTLQPGPKDGNDLWMKNWLSHPDYADTCDTKKALIKGLASALKGSVVYTRSVIKFDGLGKIPQVQQYYQPHFTFMAHPQHLNTCMCICPVATVPIPVLTKAIIPVFYNA